MFEKIGLPVNLLWGYIGLTIFMIGDGVEQAWISIWLCREGAVCCTGILPDHRVWCYCYAGSPGYWRSGSDARPA